MGDGRSKSYKVVGILTWEMEIPEDDGEVLDVAKEFLDNIVTSTPGVTARIRVDDIKRKKAQLIHIAEFPPGEILSQITRSEEKKEFTVEDKVYHVRLNSQRYFVFRDNPSCVSCGLVGSRMVLEKYPNQGTPHFNLYGEEDEELVLMTKDHIHSRANGGKDRHSNYQTMCSVCNNLKGAEHLPLEGIRELRRIHGRFKDSLSRRDFSQLVKDTKEKFKNDLPDSKRPTNNCAVCDLNIWYFPDGFVARPVYEILDANHIACLKAGQKLEIIEIDEGLCRVRFGDKYFLLYENLIKR